MIKCGQEKPGRYASIIASGSEKPPQVQTFGPKDEMDEDTLFDAQSYRTIELDALYGLLDTCRIELGRAALQRAIAHPPINSADVRARQEALEELGNNPELKSEAEALLTKSDPHEPGFFELGWSRFTGLMSGDDHNELSRGGYGYRQFKQTRVLFAALEGFGQNAGNINSGYLKGLLDDFAAMKSSRSCELLRGPAYVTETNPITRSEKAWYRFAYKFRPTLFKPLLLLFMVLIPYALNKMFSTFYTGSYYESGNNVLPILGLLMVFAIIPIVIAYIVMIGSHERDHFIKPVGGALREDPVVRRAMDALGELDVLLAHLRFNEAYPSATCLPEIVDSKHHIFEAQGLKSPIIGMDEADYVANDVSFDAARLSFITGPNSGGKTALSKSICQNQVLAQMGGYATASSARISPADVIAYQVPQPGELERREGRFATELARTRDIFFASTKHALIVLDEPFEGTSFEERLETSEQVLDGFIRLEATVLFITHNHALAELYRNKDQSGHTQFLEASFENDHPTHTFKQGIASTSHAARIANQIGFGQEDIERRFEDEKS